MRTLTHTQQLERLWRIALRREKHCRDVNDLTHLAYWSERAAALGRVVAMCRTEAGV